MATRGPGGLACSALTHTLHTGTAEGMEGLFHVDAEHPPTTRWEGYYSSPIHFTEDETEALESETGHLVKLQSGFKPQTIWALSPFASPSS